MNKAVQKAKQKLPKNLSKLVNDGLGLMQDRVEDVEDNPMVRGDEL